MISRELELSFLDIVGKGNFSKEPYEIWCYEGYNLPKKPIGIIRPGSAGEVSRIVKLAAENSIPLVPRGMASRATPAGVRQYPQTRNFLIIDMTRMNRVRSINETTMTITVEAGMTIAQINTALVSRGLRIIEGTLAPFCATAGSIVGNGPGAFKYGTRQEQIADLEVVLGTGDILQTEPGNFGALMCAKYNAPNLTEIFLKARGTLGIVTAVTFYLYPIPEKEAFYDYAFNQVDDTVAFLLAIQRESVTHLPGIYEVYIWPEHTLMLYKNLPQVVNQNDDFHDLLEKFPPYPSDIVGIVVEGTDDQIAVQKKRLDRIALEFRGIDVGPEPIRDHYIDRIWSGNTKAHEDAGGTFATFAEPHFETQITSYGKAREMTADIAEKLGFSIGKRYWRGSRLSKRMLTHSAAVTFDDLDDEERQKAGEYYQQVYQEAVNYESFMNGRIHMEYLQSGRDILSQIKLIVDPDRIMYPGIEVTEE